MTKIIVAALCCVALPAVAQAQVGHVHTASCNHQWTDDQGTYSSNLATSSSNSFAVSASNMSGGGMTFILNDIGGVGVGTQARAAFEMAATYWSSLFNDPITIRLDVQFAQLAPNVLGSTGSTTNSVAYNTVRGAMAADAKSYWDSVAVNSLQTGPLTFATNEPPASGAIDSRTRFLDNNNTTDNNFLQVNTAQMKALGLNPVYAANNPGGRDGSVSFSTSFTWDFDPTDGIDAGAIDFVGVAAHEIGHALGFRSGVDLADINALPGIALPGARGLNNIAWGTVHDLFRYGTLNGQTVLDWTIGGTPCYSIDGGANCLALLSTGRLNGDLRQASHWKDDAILGINPPIGIMDPTASGPGGTRPFQRVSIFDTIAFDVMGYDLAAVPEPGTWAMMILGFGFVGAAYRRRPRVDVRFA
jgi:hypothetical protein